MRRGREFGFPRLRRLLATKGLGAETAVRRALRQVELFAAGTPQHDDLTAMAIRIG